MSMIMKIMATRTAIAMIAKITVTSMVSVMSNRQGKSITNTNQKRILTMAIILFQWRLML